MQKLTTMQGEEHGLINEMANCQNSDIYNKHSPEFKAKMEKARKEDAKVVKARLINRKGRNNERLSKPYVRHPGDNIQIWKLIPNETYELPYGFIKEVNDPNRRRRKRTGLLDTQGKELMSDEWHDLEWELVPVSF